MIIDFLFNDDIDELINNQIFSYSDSLDEVKGLCYVTDNSFYNIINLDAEQWKLYEEDLLINELSTTIIHENCHGIIKTTDSTDRVTPDGEERVVRLLSEQESFEPSILAK